MLLGAKSTTLYFMWRVGDGFLKQSQILKKSSHFISFDYFMLLLVHKT